MKNKNTLVPSLYSAMIMLALFIVPLSIVWGIWYKYENPTHSINTLFTGFGFSAVATTIFFQILMKIGYDREIKKRDEEISNERFESRFFRLCDSLRSIKELMSIKHGSNRVTGKAVFECLIQLLYSGCVLENLNVNNVLIKDIVQHGDRIYDLHKNSQGPYFLILYNIIRYIDRSEVSNKDDYIDIVRAELSASELCLLALNGLSERGKKLKPLIEKYHLLKHMEDCGIVTRKLLETAYGPDAFCDPA